MQTPAFAAAEQGVNPDDVRDCFLLAAGSFPGGHDGSNLLTGPASPFGRFAECAREGASFISVSHTWVLMNPENEILPGFADKKRSGGVEFREICRLFGERFGVVRRIILKNEVIYEARPLSETGNILSYQMLEITVDRAFETPITGFYELCAYPGGTNYDLYWDTLPDVHRLPSTGRAKGCNIRMSGLEIRNIVTDGVQDGADFDMILPTIMRLSEYPGRMFRDLVYAEAGGEQRERQRLCLFSEENSVKGQCASPVSGEGGERSICSDSLEKAANKRISWISPDGELFHSVPREAVDVWLSYIKGTDTGESGIAMRTDSIRTGMTEFGNPEEGGQIAAKEVQAGLLSAVLTAPTGGTILLRLPISMSEREERERFLACVEAQAKLEKSILITEER